jgi:ADP-ribose pyrophosphatase
MNCSILYPAACNATVNALARFPAPTIAIRGCAEGLRDMPGSIAESLFILNSYRMAASSLPNKPKALLYIVFMPKSSLSRSNRVRSVQESRPKARLISSRTVYRGPVFSVTTDHVQEPGGVRARRDIIHHSGSVVVLAVDESRPTPRVLLERQYRHAANDYLWEIPAGRIDPGENALAAAKRELLEETGYTAAEWRRILKFYASPGFVAETMAVYLATGLRTGTAQPEADEIIHLRMVALPTAVRMVMSGTIRDAKTISSILWLDHERQGK